MLFNSYEFLLFFLPATLAGFYLLLRASGRELAYLWLTACSLAFYGWWNPVYLLLLSTSILVNYSLVAALTSGSRFRRSWVGLGVAFNLGLLAYYKYTNFLLDVFSDATGAEFTLGSIVLPLAISFFTFQQISYLVDAYRGQVRRPGLLQYTLFVTFFPQLIAGPIVQHRQLMPQLLRPRSPRLPWASIATGVTLLSIGLFKKVILADTLSQWATPVFAAAKETHVAALDAWGSMLAYTFQLYFDFSGYSDMALGLAALFGFTLPINFDSPYKATSISDLWKRWHISLSTFLRDYVYLPLGGNRRRPGRTYVNLMLTMALCGLWHGAGWTFVVWGAVHGLLLVVCRLWRLNVVRQSGWKVPVPLAWGLTFGSFALALVIFRADSIATALTLYASMLDWGQASEAPRIVGLHAWLVILGMFPIVLGLPNAVRWVSEQTSRWEWQPSWIYAVSTAAMLLVAIMRLTTVSEFLYFQF